MSENGTTTKTEEPKVIEISLEQAESYVRSGKRGRPPKAVSKKLKEVQEKRLAESKNGQPAVQSKFDLFLLEFERNGFNGTEAAMAVHGLTNRASAAVQASIYQKHAREIGRVILEKKGITLEKLLDLAWKKAQDSKDTAYWDRLAKMLGEDFINKQAVAPTVSVNINQVQREVRDEFGFGEAVEGEIKEDGETI